MSRTTSDHFVQHQWHDGKMILTLEIPPVMRSWAQLTLPVKNKTGGISLYKRVHVNNSYIILFFGQDNIVYFVDYAHHDIVYKHSKKRLKKYNNVEFSS